MLGRLSWAHSSDLTSPAEARLHDCVRPAVWSANVAVASGSSPGPQDSVSKCAEEGDPWIQPQQWQEGMRGFLSVVGFCFCFKTPYLCQVMSASTHLTACLPLFFLLLNRLQLQTVSLSALPLTCNISLFPEHSTSVPKFSHFTAFETRKQEAVVNADCK